MEMMKLFTLTNYMRLHMRAGDLAKEPELALMHAGDALRTAETIVERLQAEVERATADLALDKPKAKPAVKTPAAPAKKTAAPAPKKADGAQATA